MTALVLRWRVPAPAIVARWRGPSATVYATAQAGRYGDIAAVIGPPGQPGPTARYIHSQTSAQAQWIINHNLGYFPDVSVLSTGGMEVVAEIVHTSVNQVIVLFAVPYTGSAVLI